jgi:N-acetyl-alpha-D-glucosaminyl L-malate synthase BshA
MCHSFLGGSGHIAADLSMELSRRGHRVHLFTRGAPFTAGNLRRHVVLHQFLAGDDRASPCFEVSADWTAGEIQTLLCQLLRVISREGLDLLHFHYALPFAAVAGKIKERLGPASPLVIGTLHGTDVSLHGRHPVKGPQLAQTLRNLDGLTTVSLSHAILATRVFNLPEMPEIIPNFVDLSRFRPNLPPPKFIRVLGNNLPRQPRIVHVSNFRAVKNPRGLARIFLGIREKLEAELWLVGDGPGVGYLKAFFRDQGLAGHVHFWGAHRQVAPILAQADLLLMPSLAESFCLAALEAMACGVPVLATDVGGLPEVVVHGKTGLLFPLKEPQVAVDLAVQLLSNQVWHRAMRKAALDQAKVYEQGRVVTAYESFYEDLLASRGHRPRRCGRSAWAPGTYRFRQAASSFAHSLLLAPTIVNPFTSLHEEIG